MSSVTSVSSINFLAFMSLTLLQKVMFQLKRKSYSIRDLELELKARDESALGGSSAAAEDQRCWEGGLRG